MSSFGYERAPGRSDANERLADARVDAIDADRTLLLFMSRCDVWFHASMAEEAAQRVLAEQHAEAARARPAARAVPRAPEPRATPGVHLVAPGR